MLSADTLTADVVARVELADGWLEQIFDDFPLPEEADLEPDDREMECDDFINSVKIWFGIDHRLSVWPLSQLLPPLRLQLQSPR